MLIDNKDAGRILSQINIYKYLREEGRGKIIVRGFKYGGPVFNPHEYFDALPDNFIFSSLPGRPPKAKVKESRHLWREMRARLDQLREALDPMETGTHFEKIRGVGLTEEVFKRIEKNPRGSGFFESEEEFAIFMETAKNLVSRSEWYAFSETFFGPQVADRFKAEVIDPSYNVLFSKRGECFVLDRMKSLSSIPSIVLDASVMIRSLREELRLIEYAFEIYQFVSSLGMEALRQYLTEKAAEMVIEGVVSLSSRRSWFGMYSALKKKFGVEVCS